MSQGTLVYPRTGPFPNTRWRRPNRSGNTDPRTGVVSPPPLGAGFLCPLGRKCSTPRFPATSMPAILEHQRFVVHIDVLGMSALVAKDPELAWGLLSQLVEARKDAHATSMTFLDTAETVTTPEHVQAVTFSDTVILFSRGAGLNDLRIILVMATQMLSRALHLCVPIRVGVAVGTFFVNLDESMYAGPALIEAYHLGETAQWIGIVTSEEVYRRAIEAKLQSGSSDVVAPACIPIDGGSRPGYAVNWPVTLRNSILAPLPLTAQQVYQGFARYFGSFEFLDLRTRQKYENTAAFMNARAQ